MELDSEPGSATNFGFVADSDSATGSDSTTEENFRPTILRSVVGNSQHYDQVQCSMYMNTASVGNISGTICWHKPNQKNLSR